MINFKELIKERDAAKLRIDEINNRIDSIIIKNDFVPQDLNQELVSTEEYRKQLILRIGRSLTEENVAEPKEVVLDLDAEDTEATPFGFSKLIKLVSDEELEKLNQETPLMFGELTPLSLFNPADILQAIAGVEVSEESTEEDEELCHCNYCTSEDDENAEDILDTIIKALLVKGALNAIEAKKEGK